MTAALLTVGDELLIGQVVNMRFGRQDELESDILGVVNE